MVTTSLKRRPLEAAPARPTIPIVVAGLAQAIALVLVLVVGWVADAIGVTVTVMHALLLQGALSAVLARRFGLQSWWIPIQLVFAPAAVGLLSQGIHPLWFFAVFLLLAVTYWSTFSTRVPLFLSSDEVPAALLPLLPGHGFKFLDIGSGLGGVLRHLAAVRPDGEFHGIESAPLPYLVSRVLALGKTNLFLRWDNFWKADWRDYDVIYAYLSPVPMEEVWRKARSEMKPGSLLVSNTFAIPGVAPDQTISLHGVPGSTLYVWRIGGEVGHGE